MTAKSTMVAIALVFAAVGMLRIPAVTADSGFFVQIASVKSEARARAAWARLQRAHPILLGDLELALEKAEVGARGTFYRLRTGPFPNKTTAEDMCGQIEAAKLDCIVVGG